MGEKGEDQRHRCLEERTGQGKANSSGRSVTVPSRFSKKREVAYKIESAKKTLPGASLVGGKQ